VKLSLVDFTDSRGVVRGLLEAPADFLRLWILSVPLKTRFTAAAEIADRDYLVGNREMPILHKSQGLRQPMAQMGPENIFFAGTTRERKNLFLPDLCVCGEQIFKRF
jgi:hypothetical protein